MSDPTPEVLVTAEVKVEHIDTMGSRPFRTGYQMMPKVMVEVIMDPARPDTVTLSCVTTGCAASDSQNLLRFIANILAAPPTSPGEPS